MTGRPVSAVGEVAPGVADSERSRGRSWRLGREPISRLRMMEDHDGAYYAWKAAGVRDRILVHLDAHHDFGWIADRDPLVLLQAQRLDELERLVEHGFGWNLAGRSPEELIDIGNYLYPALSEHLVRAVYWVVPDGFTQGRRQRKALEAEFRALAARNPRGVQLHGWREGRLWVTLCGKPVVACRLADLPAIDEPVLLSIDTDYLVIPSFDDPYPHAAPWRRGPWIWPEELVARLAAAKLSSDFVTIAYSVQGGYTPPALKGLADELARLLQEPEWLEEGRAFRREFREATSAWQQGRLTEASVAYARALALRPGEAWLHYSLAELAWAEGQVDRAAAHYGCAVERDPSYRLTEERLSPVYQLRGMREQARSAYEMALAFDPTNADVHAGLGGFNADAGDWDRAVSHYQKAVAIEPAHPRANYDLGYLHARRRQWQAAETALSQVVRDKFYGGPAWFWLGHVYTKTKRRNEAIAAYEAAFQKGMRNLPLHWKMGGLYLASGRLYRAVRQYRRALRMLPAVPLVLLRRLAGRVRASLTRAWAWGC